MKILKILATYFVLILLAMSYTSAYTVSVLVLDRNSNKVPVIEVDLQQKVYEDEWITISSNYTNFDGVTSFSINDSNIYRLHIGMTVDKNVVTFYETYSEPFTVRSDKRIVLHEDSRGIPFLPLPLILVGLIAVFVYRKRRDYV